MPGRSTACRLLAGFVSLSLFACADYGGQEPWRGWIEFHQKASFKGAVCGESSLDYALGELADNDVPVYRTMMMGMGSWEAYRDRIACMDRASTCEEYWRCRLPEDAEPCQSSTFRDHCDGDTAVSCWPYAEEEYYVVRMDCSEAPGGGTCVMEGVEARCDYAQCGPYAENPRCEGDLLLACEHREYSDIYWRYDCSATGMDCLPDGSCGIPGALDCTEFAGDVCDGPLIHSCYYDDGRMWSQDCREVHPDFVCVMDAYEDGGCAMPEGSWECQEHEETWCEGDELKACLYGKILSFDCASIAGSSCESDHCTRP
ncbi:MAG: hypothetical protein JXR96_14300 [Deltaproteobacteria bacterium]|nr:hypothetical protein [Deltaproteobacteria bacterium]